jgi:hypothetical protein
MIPGRRSLFLYGIDETDIGQRVTATFSKVAPLTIFDNYQIDLCEDEADLNVL